MTTTSQTHAQRGIDLNAAILESIAWAGIVVQTGVAAWLMTQQDWADGGVMLAFAAVGVLTLVFRTRLPKAFSLFFVTAGLVNAAGFAFNLFENRVCIWYDEVAHFYTSAMVALVLSFWIFYATERVSPRWLFISIVTLLTIVIGAGWEVIEWLVGIIGSTWDTTLDMIMDAAGGLAGGFLGAWAIRCCPPERLRDPDAECES